MLPTFLLLLVLYAAFRHGRDRAVEWMLLLGLFGGSAAVFLTSLGGANLSPAVCFLPVLVWSALQRSGLKALGRELSPPLPGFWLLGVVIWGVGTAVLMPRLLEGTVRVYTTDRSSDMLAVMSVYLRPFSTNLTQSVYAVGGLVCFLACRALLQTPGDEDRLRHAMLRLARWNIVAALLNMLETYGGIWTPLSVVRETSGYSVFGSVSVGGLMRITGTFPEASSFAGFTLPLFAYCFSLWQAGVDRRQTGILSAVLFVLLVLSTSSTAYVALAIYLLVTLMWNAIRWMSTSRNGDRSVGWLIAVFWGVMVSLCVVVLLHGEWVQAVSDYIDLLVIRKGDSASGLERFEWNRAAWENFLDSWGIGLGLGTVRASSYALVLLSNIGVPGTLAFCAFMFSVAWGALRAEKEPASVRPARRAALQAMVAGLLTGLIAGTVFDLGMGNYALAAAASMGLVRGRGVRPFASSPAS